MLGSISEPSLFTSPSTIFIRQIEHPPSLEDKTKIQKTENELLAYRDDLYISLFKTLSMFNISIQHCNRICCYNGQHRLYNIQLKNNNNNNSFPYFGYLLTETERLTEDALM